MLGATSESGGRMGARGAPPPAPRARGGAWGARALAGIALVALVGLAAAGVPAGETQGFQQAVLFDGDDDYAKLEPPGLPLANQTWSLEVWAQRVGAGGGYIASQGRKGDALGLQVGFSPGGEFLVQFDVDGAQNCSTSGFSALPGQWHHWAVTYETTKRGSVNEILIYRDGTAVKACMFTTPFRGSGYFFLGRGVDVFPGTFYHGKLTEVRVWIGVALPRKVIATYMRYTGNPVQNHHPHKGNLKAYWRMVEQEIPAPSRVALLKDHSGQGRDAQLTNNPTYVRGLQYYQTPVTDVDASIAQDRHHVLLQSPMKSGKWRDIEMLWEYVKD